MHSIIPKQTPAIMGYSEAFDQLNRLNTLQQYCEKMISESGQTDPCQHCRANVNRDSRWLIPSIFQPLVSSGHVGSVSVGSVRPVGSVSVGSVSVRTCETSPV